MKTDQGDKSLTVLPTLVLKMEPRVTKTKKSQTMELGLPEGTSRMQLASRFWRRKWMTSLSQWTILITRMPAKISHQWTQWWVAATTTRVVSFSSSVIHLTGSTKSRTWAKAMEPLPSCRGPLSSETVFWSTLENPTLFLTWLIIRMTMKTPKTHQARELVHTFHTSWS